jgi:succinate dehydrogenase / fumarate reductase cytochrome b subunit
MIDMKLHLNPTVDYKDQSPFGIIVQVLGSGLSAPIYIVGTLVLGFHLSHGFWSAFQSLGLNHPKYTPLIKKLAILFAIVIAAGFVSLPLWGFFIR